MNKLIKRLTPQVLLNILKIIINKNYGWQGDYRSWDDAGKNAIGYDSDRILNKVKESLLKVQNGEAVYERDSVLFNKIQYSWPMLTGLMWVAAQNKGQLNIVDFGGSLGSSYFQNRFFLESISKVSWNIVEQDNFVRCGSRAFKNNELKFFKSIDDCLAYQLCDTIILSSVIQYIKEPYKLLREIFGYNFKYIIIDRTAFIDRGYDRLTVQKVPPEIYDASYPSWFFDKKKFEVFFDEKYTKIAEFKCDDQANIKSQFLGFIYKVKP